MPPTSHDRSSVGEGLLAQKVVLVTGAGSGLGRAIALLSSAEGASVAVADVDAGAAERVAEEVRVGGGAALALAADVSDEQAVQEMVAGVVEAFGHLDALVNNAAVPPDQTSVVDADLAQFDRVVAVNLRGVAACMKHAARQFREQAHPAPGRGPYAIVNIGSTSSVRPRVNNPAYVATKHAVLGLTKSGAIELAKFGVRVNAVLPGGMETPMIKAARERRGISVEEHAADLSLFGRIGGPEEVAEVAVWLCSDRAGYVTGASIAADAGYLAR